MSEAIAAEARALLRQHGLRPRKSLGQHFLVDTRVLHRIVRAAHLTPADTVVEVGPGLGVLTRVLARNAGRVIAVEADVGLASALQDAMGGTGNVIVVDGDILQLEPGSLVSAAHDEAAAPPYKVVANIPYYITSPILRHFLEATVRPAAMVVMVQKEVGEAIVARPGRMSMLGLTIQFYGKPSLVCRVPARSFYPPPKVESVVLHILPWQEPPVQVSDRGRFFAVARAGFAAPRKQLRNSLSQGLSVSPVEAADILDKAGIDSQRRPATLSIEEWARLYEEVEGRACLRGDIP